MPLSEAFLSTLTARLRPLFPAGLFRTVLPSCLNDFTVVVLDDKKIKNAAKRLLARRGRPGKLFGGKILAAYLPASGLVVALAAEPDGEANDIRLIPCVMPLAGAAVQLPFVAPERKHTWHQFVIRTAQRGSLLGALERSAIHCGVLYPVPVYQQPAYGSAVSLPETERACAEVLSLPLHLGITPTDVDRVAEAVRAYFRG